MGKMRKVNFPSHGLQEVFRSRGAAEHVMVCVCMCICECLNVFYWFVFIASFAHIWLVARNGQRLTKVIFININWDIRVDWLFIWFAKCHVVSFLKIGGSQTARFAYFHSYRSRKHCDWIDFSAGFALTLADFSLGLGLAGWKTEFFFCYHRAGIVSASKRYLPWRLAVSLAKR